MSQQGVDDSDDVSGPWDEANESIDRRCSQQAGWGAGSAGGGGGSVRNGGLAGGYQDETSLQWWEHRTSGRKE
jgi:hypothetical protein